MISRKEVISPDIESALSCLSDVERRVINLRFGLIDGRHYTLEQVGKKIRRTRERVRQIQSKALRKLRHPKNSKRLEDISQQYGIFTGERLNIQEPPSAPLKPYRKSKRQQPDLDTSHPTEDRVQRAKQIWFADREKALREARRLTCRPLPKDIRPNLPWKSNRPMMWFKLGKPDLITDPKRGRAILRALNTCRRVQTALMRKGYMRIEVGSWMHPDPKFKPIIFKTNPLDSTEMWVNAIW